MATAAIFLASGFEEVEAMVPIDILRRAGVELKILGVGQSIVESSHGVKIVCDELLGDQNASFDALILPGGMPGAANLYESQLVQDLVLEQVESGRTLGAICAAPAVVLGQMGLLVGREFTCYPGFETKVSGAIHSTDSVVLDENIITSRGVGTAHDFALALVRNLLGAEVAEEVARKTLLL